MSQISLLQQIMRLCALQDSTGNWGGSLILSTTTAGSSSSSSGQPVDRLTIDSSGLATFTAGQTHCQTHFSPVVASVLHAVL